MRYVMRYYRMRKRKKKILLPINIGIGLLFALFLISLGLILAIHLRFLYYADIKWFDLEQTTGLSFQEIKANYDALIDYNSPFFHGDLVFPTLPSSAAGLSHFAEVKVLFQFFYVSFAITFVALIGIVLYQRKKEQYQYLRVASITSIVLPVITLLGCSINFEASFTFLHKLFFRNDDWLFDPVTDPIITLLPAQFFLQCAIVIATVVILGSLILYLRYRHYKKIDRATPLVLPKVNYYY